MGHIRGADRSEILLFPQAIDDYITEDNPVRFIDAFVVSLDLAGLGFARATPAATGRPASDPADLLKLYVYGYLNRVRSSRMLEREAERNGVKQRYYRTTACKTCPARSGCTENNRGRTIKRLMDEDVRERMAQRLKSRPEKMRLRSQLVEHPFGTMKRGMNQGCFLLRGLRKAAAEMSLTVLCYNLRRALNILGTSTMVGAVA